ncbi:MAG: hypothetical protein M1821_009598 [Bathelium mastoideum]|nr:MAG: hypothetical protein M1821_009598 [Bathelium mastoideum]
MSQPPGSPCPLIDLPLCGLRATMRAEPYITWVSIRALDAIYNPTFQEAKQSLVRAMHPDPRSSSGRTFGGARDGAQASRQFEPESCDYFWRILAWRLAQRFAYLMGKVSKYDDGVKFYVEYVKLQRGIHTGEFLFSLLQQALLIRLYQPGGFEPAIREIIGELPNIRHHHEDSRLQALRDRANRNAQRMEELERELERAFGGLSGQDESSDGTLYRKPS